MENTIIILVADHGESLGEHDYHEHRARLYEDILNVPLIIRLPGNQNGGIVIDDLVKTVDITPTVFQFLDIKPNEPHQGRSLLPLIFGLPGAAEPESYSETLHPPRIGEQELRALTTERFKLILAPAIHGYGFYDLQTDPHELKNLLEIARKDPELFNSSYKQPLLGLERRLKDVINSTVGAPLAPEPLDEESKKQLRSLGYM